MYKPSYTLNRHQAKGEMKRKKGRGEEGIFISPFVSVSKARETEAAGSDLFAHSFEGKRW